jgi:outer membrane receptor protein involved in Fe transport
MHDKNQPRKNQLQSIRAHTYSILSIVFGLTLMTTSLGFAQGTRGTISGKVIDPSGGILQGASVKLTNVARPQDARTVQTNLEGIYRFLEIEPANYEITITASGFAEKKITEIKVEPNRNLVFDISLSVAGTSESVTVSTATAELIDRESPTLGTTIDSRRVVDLPLDGRNITQLTLLQPGVVETGVTTGATPFGTGLGIRVNGARGTENNVTLDGANNNEVAIGGTVGFQLKPDAVQEFRLLTSNYEAEFGRNSGSVINVVTKSGTNQYHGNARIFYRPTFLSAARFFDQDQPGDQDRSGVGDKRRRFERKEYGGNFGGPIPFPKRILKDRAFFFADFERRNQLIGSSQDVSNLPSLAERQGLFTRLPDPNTGAPIPLIDPATGAPFPIVSGSVAPGQTIQQQIDPGRFSPIAQYYLGFLPAPNPLTGSATVGADQVRNFDQYTMRLDFPVTEKQTFGYTFNYFDNATLDPFAFGGPPNGASVPGFGSLDLRTTNNHIVRHTYTISPSMVNSLLLGYARNKQPSISPQNQTTPSQIGFTGNFVLDPQFAGPPMIFLYDRGINFGNSFQGPQARVSENFQLQDSLSWSKGSHRFKFGFDGTLYKQDQAFLFINQGIIGYTSTAGGNTTGDDFADFLIGSSPFDFQIGSNGLKDFRQRTMAFFGQDSFRVNDKLTLSLGLRWEYTSPITDKFNRVAYYRYGATSQLLSSGQLTDFAGNPITLAPGATAPNGVVYTGDPDPVLGGNVPRGGIKKDYNNFAPRIGIAYTPTSSKGWLGKLLGNRDTVIRTGFGIYYGALIGDTALQQLSAPGFSGTDAYFPLQTGTLANPFAPDPFPNYNNDPTQDPNQGQIPFNPVTQSQLLVQNPLAQFSQPIDPNIRTPYTYQYNVTVERGFLNNYVISLSYVGNRGLKQYGREQINPAFGTFIPFPTGRDVLPVTTGGENTNDRRINPEVRVGLNQLVSAGRSWYNAFETSVQRRYSNGLLFQVAYTFSKSITELDTQRGSLDLLDRSFGRGLSGDDAPHRFVGSFVYDLPFAKYLGNSSNLSKRALGGWKLSGIATFQSGLPFTVNNPFNTTGTGGGIMSFADLGAPFQLVDDPRQSGGRAFNIDAFRPFGNPATGFNLLTDFRRGTSGANQFRLNNGINNFNFSLSKETQLWRDSTKLEMRLESFNAFNHTQFLDADLNLIGNVGGLNPNFGKYISTRESRVIQLGARFIF